MGIATIYSKGFACNMLSICLITLTCLQRDAAATFLVFFLQKCRIAYRLYAIRAAFKLRVQPPSLGTQYTPPCGAAVTSNYAHSIHYPNPATVCSD